MEIRGMKIKRGDSKRGEGGDPLRWGGDDRRREGTEATSG